MRTAGVPTPTVPGPPGHPLVHRFQTDRPDLAFVPPHPWRSSLPPIPPALHTGGYPYVPLREPPPRPAFLEGILVRPSPATPSPPALRAPPPPPGGGEGSHDDIRDKPCPGAAAASVSREGTGRPGRADQNPVLPRVLPVQWTVVAIAMGGGDRGGGLPPPRRRVPVRSSSKPSPPEGGQYVGYPGKTVPRMQTPRKWKKDDDLLR